MIPKRFIINAPTEQLESTLRELPYPLHRLHLNGSIQYDDDRDSFHFLSPLKYRNPEHLQNIDYGVTMKQFVERLNREHGRYHLEAFCLTACLTNYPPIFVPEDFHISDLELLRRHIEDVKVGGNGRVWQTLKRLSEGKEEDDDDMDSIYGSRASVSEYDASTEYTVSTLRERFCGRNGRESSFKRVYLEVFHSVPFQRELTLRNVGYSSNRSEWIKSLKIMPL